MLNNIHPDFQRQQIKVLYYATLVLFLPLSAGIFFLVSKEKNEQPIVEQADQITPISISLQNTQTTAHSAIVVNLETGEVLYEKNPDKLLPLASLTKLVTAKVSSQELKSETLSINKLTEFAQYGDINLEQGQNWNKDELITYTLLTSSNDGAHSLLSNVSPNTESFTNKMNSLVASIGLVETSFKNETGLDNDSTGVPNSKGTAREFTALLKYLIQDDISLFEETTHSNLSVKTPQGTIQANNTNEFADAMPGLLLSKTGYTNLAGGNLAVVADMGLNEPVAFVVLKSSKESRFDDIIKLQDAYFEEVRKGMR